MRFEPRSFHPGPGVALAAVLVLTNGILGCATQEVAPPPPPPAPTIASVSVSPASATVEVGTTQQFTATVQGTGSFNPAVRWLVNDVEGGNSTVGTITSAGLYTAPANLPTPNTVSVKAVSVADPTKSDSASVTLIALQSIAITPTLGTLLAGDSQQLTATGTYTNNSTRNLTDQVEWTTADLTVATVSNTGLLSAVGAGSTIVRATKGAIQGSSPVNVIDIVSLSISPESPLTRVGLAQQFTAIGRFTDDSLRDLTSRVEWISSDTAIATIDEQGLDRPTKSGTATILARFRSSEARTSLLVAEVEFAVTPTDPLLWRIVGPSQENIEYIGTRDAAGLPAELTAIVTRSPEGDVVIQKIEEQGLRHIFYTSDGAILRMVRKSETLVGVTVISADGAEQIVVDIDLSELEKAGVTDEISHTEQIPPPAAPRMRTILPQCASALQPPKGHGLDPAEELPPWVNATLEVRQCETGINNALAQIQFTDASETRTILGERIGDGLYGFKIPTSMGLADVAVENACLFSVGVATAFCTAKSWYENILRLGCTSETLSQKIFGKDLGKVWATGCKLGFAAGGKRKPLSLALTIGCILWDEVKAGTKEDCRTLLADTKLLFGSGVHLKPVVTIPGQGTFVGETVLAGPAGPFPLLPLELPGKLNIAEFFTFPEDPDPFENYVATAIIRCAPPGTVVHLSISGTDGYQDATQCVISGNQSCSLFVPGTFEGVIETLTVLVGDLVRIITIVC